jgi:hypothetical protein
MKNTKQKNREKIKKLDIKKIDKAMRSHLEGKGISKEWLNRHLVVI